jgi:hypothetical protein
MTLLPYSGAQSPQISMQTVPPEPLQGTDEGQLLVETHAQPSPKSFMQSLSSLQVTLA